MGGGSGDIAPLGLQGLGEQLALLGIQPGREGVSFGLGIFWRGGCSRVGGRTWGDSGGHSGGCTVGGHGRDGRGQRCRGCLAQALVAQGDVAVQEVFQLAHIARQGQALHMLQQGRAGRRHGQAVFLRHIGQQALAQQGQVFAALAQGGQLHVNDIQAVEQVLAKAPRLHIVGQVAVGGADDAHVHAFFLGGPQGTHAALLDGAQQLGLHGQG